MKLKSSFSERISILRFPLIIGIIFIHSSGASVNFSNGASGVSHVGIVFQMVQNVLSDGIARISVPLLFIFSGYLFFLGLNNSKKDFIHKYKRRIYTLVIPFLFWNALTLILLFVAQSFPVTSVFFSHSKQLISTFVFYDFFNSILGIDKSPIAYQFWFIRDLFIMVTLVPLLEVILKRKTASSGILLLLFTFWFFNYWPIYIPSIKACFFFYTGAYLNRSKINLFFLDRYGVFVTLCYFFVLIIDCITKNKNYNEQLHNLGIVLGIIALLYFSKILYSSNLWRNLLLKLSPLSFFVFAVHEPMLTVLKKLLYKIIVPNSDISVILLFFTIPTFIIFFSVFIYHVLRTFSPKFLNIISGGR